LSADNNTSLWCAAADSYRGGKEKETPMIVEYIRYKIDPSRADEFKAAYTRAGELLDASPHCLRWEAARCVDDPHNHIVRIEWDSSEGHLQGFRQSADFKPFLEATGPFYNDIEEMTHYDVTSASSKSADRAAAG
jgi:quinol monooxygenase YgiN